MAPVYETPPKYSNKTPIGSGKFSAVHHVRCNLMYCLKLLKIIEPHKSKEKFERSSRYLNKTYRRLLKYPPSKYFNVLTSVGYFKRIIFLYNQLTQVPGSRPSTFIQLSSVSYSLQQRRIKCVGKIGLRVVYQIKRIKV